MPRRPFRRLALIVRALIAPAGSALAWGSTGHRIIGRLAVESLPDSLPAFLRTAESAEAVGGLAREPDRWKDSGRTHDSDRDPAHFIDLGDDGKVFGGPALSDLSDTRAGYETALRAVNSDGWKAGYLPYAIIDGWQQLVKDFTFWRIEAAAAEQVADAWRASASGHAGWPAVSVADVEAGKVDPYDSMYGVD